MGLFIFNLKNGKTVFAGYYAFVPTDIFSSLATQLYTPERVFLNCAERLPIASCWLQPVGCTDWEWGEWEEYEVIVIVSCRLAVVVFLATPQDSYCSVPLYYSYSFTYNYCFPRF